MIRLDFCDKSACCDVRASRVARRDRLSSGRDLRLPQRESASIASPVAAYHLRELR